MELLLCTFLHYPVTSSLLGPYILLSILFSITLTLCSSHNVKDQVSHPHKTKGEIMVLHILIFTISDSRHTHHKSSVEGTRCLTYLPVQFSRQSRLVCDAMTLSIRKIFSSDHIVRLYHACRTFLLL
jgi:hypothetical protein